MEDVSEWYKFIPELTEDVREALRRFSEEHGRVLASRTEDLFGALNGGNSLTLNISLEEVLSPSIPTNEAFGVLKTKLEALNPVQKLYVIDPYIFPRKYEPDYSNNVASLLSVIQPNIEITIVTRPDYNRNIYSIVSGHLNQSRKLLVKESMEIHDRFWVSDSRTGLLLGNSLNGIGKKYFIFRDLAQEDCDDLLRIAESL